MRASRAIAVLTGAALAVTAVVPAIGATTILSKRRTAPVHTRRELHAARAAGADLLFLSPVFATRTHPGGATLGPLRFGSIARGVPCVVALGGMDARRMRRLKALGSYGWAAIDALTPNP